MSKASVKDDSAVPTNDDAHESIQFMNGLLYIQLKTRKNDEKERNFMAHEKLMGAYVASHSAIRVKGSGKM